MTSQKVYCFHCRHSHLCKHNVTCYNCGECINKLTECKQAKKEKDSENIKNGDRK